MRLFLKEKNFSKIASFFPKIVLRFLSLRYGADFRRSRVVLLFTILFQTQETTWRFGNKKKVLFKGIIEEDPLGIVTYGVAHMLLIDNRRSAVCSLESLRQVSDHVIKLVIFLVTMSSRQGATLQSPKEPRYYLNMDSENWPEILEKNILVMTSYSKRQKIPVLLAPTVFKLKSALFCCTEARKLGT